jgi:hypothetical protein
MSSGIRVDMPHGIFRAYLGASQVFSLSLENCFVLLHFFEPTL